MTEDDRYTYLASVGRFMEPYECDRCGAIVDYKGIDQHNAWHVRLEEVDREVRRLQHAGEWIE